MPNGPVALGLLSPRGEKAVLTVPIEVLMRVTSNPFFPYMARRVSEWVSAMAAVGSLQSSVVSPQ